MSGGRFLKKRPYLDLILEGLRAGQTPTQVATAMRPIIGSWESVLQG
jgi:hypothetical protein